jgi:Fe-S oxidoreductase
MMNLFPTDEDAKRLTAQSFLLSEFLEKKATHFTIPELKRKALMHGHCHHKAIMKLADEEAVLKKMKVDFTIPDSGCCGMAGAFGFEEGDHYDVSIKVGERSLLPSVRSASTTELIIADGFSCREQISQRTDRHAMHLAEVIQMAMREQKDGGDTSPYPERRYITEPDPSVAANTAVWSLLAAASAAFIYWLFLKRGNNKGDKRQ